ncbi:MAG: FAD-binding protein, partial [Sphingobium sp.]
MRLAPVSPDDLIAAVMDARRDGVALEIASGGSKRAIGLPDRETRIIDMAAFAGIVAYDPPELVLTVRPATRLAELEAILAAEGQMLAFDPFDHGPLLGKAPGAATIGGIVAAGVSGSRRLSAGGARDHLLGFAAISGRGEAFVAGGKVVKNVTGYDVSKLMAGSWGRLAILTELTLKILPRPRHVETLALRGLSEAAAMRVMARMMGSPAEVAAAAHLPGVEPLTLLRLEGFEPSVLARIAMLRTLLGEGDVLDRDEADALWRDVRTMAPLASAPVLWRISVPPGAGAACAARLPGDKIYDWAGALVWLGADVALDPSDVSRAAEAAGGHAMLVRGPPALR